VNGFRDTCQIGACTNPARFSLTTHGLSLVPVCPNCLVAEMEKAGKFEIALRAPYQPTGAAEIVDVCQYIASLPIASARFDLLGHHIASQGADGVGDVVYPPDFQAKPCDASSCRQPAIARIENRFNRGRQLRACGGHIVDFVAKTDSPVAVVRHPAHVGDVAMAICSAGSSIFKIELSFTRGGSAAIATSPRARPSFQFVPADAATPGSGAGGPPKEPSQTPNLSSGEPTPEPTRKRRHVAMGMWRPRPRKDTRRAGGAEE
jgi:hypothetical protein